MDAQTLNVLTKVKDAHGFSITCIAISPDRRLLASASADNTCRIVSLPLQFNNALSINPLYTLLLAIIVAAFLLWLTTVLDLDPYFKAREEAYMNTEISSSSVTSDLPTSTMAYLETSSTIESIINTIISEAPAIAERVIESRDEL